MRSPVDWWLTREGMMFGQRVHLNKKTAALVNELIRCYSNLVNLRGQEDKSYAMELILSERIREIKNELGLLTDN
jgi:hypothetical protein